MRPLIPGSASVALHNVSLSLVRALLNQAERAIVADPTTLSPKGQDLRQRLELIDDHPAHGDDSIICDSSRDCNCSSNDIPLGRSQNLLGTEGTHPTMNKTVNCPKTEQLLQETRLLSAPPPIVPLHDSILE